MYTTEIRIRVRYGETDRMGYVYYGNYAQYFEVARVEALRELGMNYKEMEDNGIMLPVYTFNVKYFKPALYDDFLTIKTSITELPKARITFHHIIYNEKGERLNTGEVVLVFINMKSNRPMSAPKNFIEKLSPYF